MSESNALNPFFAEESNKNTDARISGRGHTNDSSRLVDKVTELARGRGPKHISPSADNMDNSPGGEGLPVTGNPKPKSKTGKGKGKGKKQRVNAAPDPAPSTQKSKSAPAHAAAGDQCHNPPGSTAAGTAQITGAEVPVTTSQTQQPPFSGPPMVDPNWLVLAFQSAINSGTFFPLTGSSNNARLPATATVTAPATVSRPPEDSDDLSPSAPIVTPAGGSRRLRPRERATAPSRRRNPSPSPPHGWMDDTSAGQLNQGSIDMGDLVTNVVMAVHHSLFNQSPLQFHLHLKGHSSVFFSGEQKQTFPFT